MLKELQGSGGNICIQTKSDLVLRDIDLIKTFSNFPGISDVKAIIDRVKNQCRCTKKFICAATKLIGKILTRNLICTKKIGLDYVTNTDDIHKPFDAPPTVVNFFYHEKIKKSAQKN